MVWEKYTLWALCPSTLFFFKSVNLCRNRIVRIANIWSRSNPMRSQALLSASFQHHSTRCPQTQSIVYFKPILHFFPHTKMANDSSLHTLPLIWVACFGGRGVNSNNRARLQSLTSLKLSPWVRAPTTVREVELRTECLLASSCDESFGTTSPHFIGKMPKLHIGTFWWKSC